MKLNQDQLLNSFVYQKKLDNVKRSQNIRLSRLRILLHLQLDKYLARDKEKLFTQMHKQLFKTLFEREDPQFYQFALKPSVNQPYQQYIDDNTSHFISRALYCGKVRHREDFINFERTILHIKLNREKQNRILNFGVLSRALLNKILGTKKDFSVPKSEWQDIEFKDKIIRGCPLPPPDKDNQLRKKDRGYLISDFSKLPFQVADYAVRKRRSFIHKGFVYVHPDLMIEIILSNYSDYLMESLLRTEKSLSDIFQADTQDQLKTFLRQTVDQMNQSSQKQVDLQTGENLTIRNIQAVWPKFFPPCMRYLTQNLKEKGHLKHEGRRQLWLFFKGCGMASLENQEFFRRHMSHKVSQSEMRGHIYNIQHAYGQVGKKQPEHSKTCRNIILGTEPKRDQYHGCPFKHWDSGQLKEYIRKFYKVSEDNIKQILSAKQQKRFQFACGKLFEAHEPNQRIGPIPNDIIQMVGKSPHENFKASMEINKRFMKKRQQQGHMDLQF